MKDDDEDDRPAPHLELPKTGLAVLDGELVRRSDKGGMLLRIPLDDIDAVEFSRPFNFTCLVPFGLAAGFVALGVLVSEYNVVTVILYVLALCLAAFALFGLRNDVVILFARNQPPVHLSCDDSSDVVSGFVLSLKALIGGR